MAFGDTKESLAIQKAQRNVDKLGTINLIAPMTAYDNKNRRRRKLTAEDVKRLGGDYKVGQVVDWDIKTKTLYNRNVVQKAAYKEITGTETPYKDLQYLRKANELKIYKSRLENDAFAQIRRRLSPKTDVGGGHREIDWKREAEIKKREDDLFNLSIGTSYDQALNPKSPGYKDGGTEIAQGAFINDQFVRSDGAIDNSTTPPTETGQKPITVTDKEKTDDTNKAIKEVEKNNAFSNRASGNGGPTTADTMKIANKDLRYDDPNYKLTSIQQKLVDGGWTRKELQIKREQHQKWLKDNNRI